MDKLLHTSLYRAILKSLNRKATSEKRLQTYFFEFANEITIICNNTEYLSVLHTLNYTQIQFQYLLFRLPELSVPPPPYVSRFILKALEFIRLEKELLYYRLEHPRLFISDPVPKSSLYWSKQYHAIDQIGRASCRERVQISVVAVSLKKIIFFFFLKKKKN